MSSFRKSFINDYLQRESVGLTRTYGQNAFLYNLIQMNDDDKEKLYHLIEELKQNGSNEPLAWAIQDVDKAEDYGGSAYFLFIQELIKIYKDVDTTIEELKWEDNYKEFIDNNVRDFGDIF